MINKIMNYLEKAIGPSYSSTKGKWVLWVSEDREQYINIYFCGDHKGNLEIDVRSKDSTIILETRAKNLKGKEIQHLLTTIISAAESYGITQVKQKRK